MNYPPTSARQTTPCRQLEYTIYCSAASTAITYDRENKDEQFLPLRYFVLIGLIWGLGVANAESVAGPASEGESMSIPASKIAFSPTGMKSKAGEVMAGAAFGNMLTGKHGTFIKFPAGYVTPKHTHTEYYYAAVLKGTVVNTQIGKKEIPLTAGSYWFQRGEEEHVTKCVSTVDCLFFLSMPGKFVHTNSKE